MTAAQLWLVLAAAAVVTWLVFYLEARAARRNKAKAATCQHLRRRTLTQAHGDFVEEFEECKDCGMEMRNDPPVGPGNLKRQLPA